MRIEDLSLNDREVDLNLVEPARVDRSVDKDGVGPFGAEAADSFLAETYKRHTFQHVQSVAELLCSGDSRA